MYSQTNELLKQEIQDQGVLFSVELVDEMQYAVVQTLQQIVQRCFNGVQAESLCRAHGIKRRDAEQLIANESALFCRHLGFKLTCAFQNLLETTSHRRAARQKQPVLDARILQTFAQVCSQEYREQISLLNRRFSLINGGNLVKDCSNPVSPLNLAAMVQSTVRETGLLVCDPDALYHAFTSLLSQGLPVIYKELNQFLVARGILPNLH